MTALLSLNKGGEWDRNSACVRGVLAEDMCGQLEWLCSSEGSSHKLAFVHVYLMLQCNSSQDNNFCSSGE